MINRKFHIRSDMEGVSGVVAMSQVTPGSPDYAEARSWYMAELLALIEGLLEGGSSEVTVYDEHWFGRNVDVARIPRGVRVICGKPPYQSKWAGGLDASHAGLILHGLHSMKGSGHTLCHTYEPDFNSIHLNGKPVGEIGLEAGVAGDFGVPLVLVIADSAGVAEARKLAPGVIGVATKISRGCTGAECLSLADTTAAIREAAARVAESPPRVKPLRLASPVEMDCSFQAGAFLEALRSRAKKHFVSADTLRLVGPTVTSVWARYWQLKLATQSDLK